MCMCVCIINNLILYNDLPLQIKYNSLPTQLWIVCIYIDANKIKAFFYKFNKIESFLYIHTHFVLSIRADHPSVTSTKNLSHLYMCLKMLVSIWVTIVHSWWLSTFVCMYVCICVVYGYNTLLYNTDRYGFECIVYSIPHCKYYTYNEGDDLYITKCSL